MRQIVIKYYTEPWTDSLEQPKQMKMNVRWPLVITIGQTGSLTPVARERAKHVSYI
jgi:hypothetical protein